MADQPKKNKKPNPNTPAPVGTRGQGIVAPLVEGLRLDSFRTYAAPLYEPGGTSSSPKEIFDAEIKEIQDWAKGNQRDARRDFVRFWSLKIPAILTSASAGVLAYYTLNQVALIAGAIASACVAIDAIYPGGLLRNVHYRAFSELRSLQQNMAGQWRIGVLRKKDEYELAAEIIEKAQVEKQRIAAYLTDAESAALVITAADAKPKANNSGTPAKVLETQKTPPVTASSGTANARSDEPPA